MRDTGINSRTGKDHNRTLILRLIGKHKMISRKEITKRTGLTKGAVTRIVNALMESSLVEESESPGTDGRIKSLRIGMKNRYFLCFYLSRVKLTGAVMDSEGVICHREVIYDGVRPRDNETLLDNLDRLISDLVKGSGISLERILAVSVALPGAFNVKSPNQGNSAVFDLKEMGLDEYFKGKFEMPVLFENNSNLAALAESWFGYGKEASNFIEYTIGEGVGSGVIHQGALYQGPYSHSCVIGHATVDYKGELCFCGNRGCLDKIGSLRKLVAQYREKKEGQLFQGDNQDFTRYITELKFILKKGREGDPLARDIIRHQADILANGVVTLFNLYNPECVVIVEDDLEDVNLDLLVEYIAEYARQRVFPGVVDQVKVIHSPMGEDIYLKGAYAQALEYFFDNYTLLENLKE